MTPTDHCILHHGATCDGYGVKKFKNKNVRAHRLAYCIANGLQLEEIKDKLVMHACDNRLCVNPKHLSLGTHYENCQDKVKKGRQARGETCGNSKLTTVEVIEIKYLLASGSSISSVSKRFNVSAMCVSRIKSGKTWSHVWEG